MMHGAMKLSRKNPANRNITRMEHEKVRGYWVRVVKDGKLHQKLFSDGQYGGKRKAITAARAYRDELRRRLFGEHADAGRRICTSFKSNSSGVVGVHYVEKQRGNSVSQAYVASWCPTKGGPQRHKYFSVKKLGKREAFRQAVDFRQARVEEILKESTPRRPQ
ncbi:AP2 domain-containing protein [Thiohalomonas denitrificans]|uniref:AP2 domain-containing protein n=2 Tax=Thiohalomonas denitrificans TaxID=415747 RepID=A0A1G5QQF3_9GAMM|nr:AP2 domain-containing protein [Thiohalomonas denitrificans]